jgi:hypothetical protein
MPRQSFSRPWVICIHSKTKRKGWGLAMCLRSRTPDEKMSKWIQNIIFRRHVRVQKDLEDISAGIGIFLCDKYKFCPEIDVKVDEVNFDLAW